MTITFEGEERKRFVVPTGCFSVDIALHGGLHIPAGYEIYGFTHVGKSTLCYDWAGLTRPKGKIALADYEHYDQSYLAGCLKHVGFSGTVNRLPIGTGEEVMTCIRDCLLDPEYQSAILDSVGALVPRIEIEEPVAPQGYGTQKAKLMAQAMRLVMYALLRNPATFFATNHLHKIIGIGRGTTTTGGVAIHNLSAIRIRLGTEKVGDNYVIAQGRVDKHRWGGKGGAFKLVIIPGYGIHRGLTAVVDAIWYELAEEDRTVQMNGKKYGYMKTLARKAINGEVKIFEPFMEALDELGAKHRAGATKKNTGK